MENEVACWISVRACVYSKKMDKATKVKILTAAKAELIRHGLNTFVSEGGSGVVVTGCPGCRKKLQTVNQLMCHLAEDVLPKILRMAFEVAYARGDYF
jgi:hypothetical protein